MAESKGIKRYLELLLDRERANRTQREAQDAINKGTDPKKGQQNLSHMDRAFDGIGRTALKLGGILAGVFALGRIKDFGVAAVKAFSESEAVWSQLGGTLEGVGVSFAGVRDEIEAAARAMQDATTIGDEDFAKSLQTLVLLSGDYAASMKNVGLVVDLAAAKNISYEAAATLVGKAMAGNTTQLARMFPRLKESADAIGDLTEQLDGQAELMRGTWAGAVKALGEEWEEFKEAIGEAITQAGGGTSVLETLTGAIRGLTIWIGTHQAEIDAFAASMQKIVGFLGDALSRLPRVIENLKRLDNFARPVLPSFLGGENRIATVLPPAQATPPGGRLPGITITAPKIGGAAESGQAAATETVNAFKATVTALLAEQGGPGGGGLIGSVLVGPDFLERQTQLAQSTAQVWSDANQDMLFAGQSAALGVMDAWSNAFLHLRDEGATAGTFIVDVFKGMGVAALGSLAQYAAGKVAENIANAFESFALASKLGALGLVPLAALAANAGRGYIVSAAKWGLVGGLAGAGAGALSGGGGGGGTSSRTDTAGRGIDQATPRGPEIHIYIDPLDPSRPAYQRNVAEATQYARERFGPNGKITVHPAGAAR